MTAAGRPVDLDPAPCIHHTDHAYITTWHKGHCCFWPPSQTCHPVEVAAWEAKRDRLRATFRAGTDNHPTGEDR